MNQTFQLPKTITLTDAAADRVKHIMAQSDENYLGVRLGLKNAGCAGMEYTMEYATEILPQEEELTLSGVEGGTAHVDQVKGAQPLQGEDVLAGGGHTEHWHHVLVH